MFYVEVSDLLIQLECLLDFISELHIALLVHRIDVAEHALYRTRKANLEVLLGMSHYRTYFDYQQNICSWHHL
ncbi:hypothetical protein DPMN_110926 [Dreissena polymorpha]|uniref:Uncharacterized protein n=1 Tax=Dreissena polymorpha TaxID=45954 RepID=A0A9D4KDJ9_DREPO|nr:hypothetical protein DPMN_110926 [Dreissena polymorpha]